MEEAAEIETGIEEVPDPLSAPGDGNSVTEAGSINMNILNVPPDAREKWGEASQLLYQPGYIHVLKQMALSGQMQMYNIRSVAWRLFLGCLPEDQTKWEAAVKKSREQYNYLKKKHITDPHIASASLDVTINNPLSQAEDSPWHQFFLDNELRQLINQDVVRTFPDVSFFKQQHIQETMLDLLFIYSKEKPELCYRQGMHELLAPIIFVLHAEERDHDDITLAPEVQIVMDSDYLEHDAYTIFTELMENMEQWYMSSALEVDHFRTFNQTNRNRKMQHDPRTQKPFEDKEISMNSAISRKLEMIHHVLLKRADEVFYSHLKLLNIPPQTYGIRWIRLLFGREFPLPSVLELWDALFADGPSLGLMDYITVAMLMHIREVLIEGDYAVCMQHLMRFPVVYEVNYLVQRALHLRNPNSFPSPRIWTYHPNKTSKSRPPPSEAVIQLMDESFATGTGTGGGGGGVFSFKAKAQQNTEKFTDFLQSKRLLPKSSSASRGHSGGGGGGGTVGTGRLEFRTSPSSRSPSPTRKLAQATDNGLTDEQLFSGASGGGSSGGKRTGRFKILGDRNKSAKVGNSGREMTNNPRTHPVAEASLSELERLTARLEDLEAKCLYCGGKMDSVIGTLQEEIPEIPNLPPDTENTLFLAIAGLKQIRDLLLKKIQFSGDSTLGWDSALGWDIKDTRTLSSDVPVANHIAGSATPSRAVSSETTSSTGPTRANHTLPEESREAPPSKGAAGGSIAGAGAQQEEVGSSLSHTDSLCEEEEEEEDDWVNLSSSSHPLVTSNN